MISTVLAFLLTLGVLIVVHEYGHYRVAVACGVKVLRFSIGFGRPLLRWQRGETEFVLCALPLGGYVRMLDEREDGVLPGERDRAFNRKPLRQRTAIVAAGPLANLGLAVVLLAASQWIGVQEAKAVLGTPLAGSLAQAADLRAGDWVRSAALPGGEWEDVESMADLRWRVTRAALDGQPLQLMLSDRQGHGSRTVLLPLDALETKDVDAAALRRIGLGAPFSDPVLGDLQPGGPAAQAGLAKGDRVLAINGEPVGDAQALRERIRAAVVEGQPQRLLWRVERAGSVRDITVTPRLVDDGGQLRGRIDAYVGAAPEMVTVRRGPVDGLAQGLARTWEISTLTVRMIGRMLVGEASVKNLSGPLTIADAAGQSVERGLAYYLGFLALVSVSLGVLNLLPLPMLDGGHLMYYLFEGVTGRPVSEVWLARLQRGGIAVLVVMMSVALFNDVARLLGLH
ncbi:MAG: RIP metalloprotease RseP [Burkholderiaceae bacterium]|nr:RIP metalloprotease RseP [Burkholderiaceae bacterium]